MTGMAESSCWANSSALFLSLWPSALLLFDLRRRRGGEEGRGGGDRNGLTLFACGGLEERGGLPEFMFFLFNLGEAARRILSLSP
jgi:hypothetical protein